MRGRLASHSQPVSLLLLIAASASLPAAAIHFFISEENAPIGYDAHFILAGGGAVIALAAAIALTAVGAARGERRIAVVGTAFSAMAGLLLVHGLATEDVLIGEHISAMVLTGGAALPVAGAVISLSALPSLQRPGDVGWLVWLNVAIFAVIAALGTIALLAPGAVPEVPSAGSPAAVAALVCGWIFFGLLAVRSTRTYALTRRRADLAVACGVLTLGSALAPVLLFGVWSWGWWIGHGFEFVGIGLIGVPVAFDIHRAGQSRPLIGDLRGADLVAREEAYLGVQVRALMVRLAEKDPYTEGHTRRVALLAVEVGDQLGLSPVTLRELAIGGLLHDIGKLSVPDEILKKPGALTDAEYTVIKRHPEWGERLLSELGGFSPQVHLLVLHHHARLDGQGYPPIGGHEIDLPTRALTACDVYDALISKRVYRTAWSTARALALLHEESGSAFDPRCVAALDQVIARRSGHLESAAHRNGRSRGPRTRPATTPLPSS